MTDAEERAYRLAVDAWNRGDYAARDRYAHEHAVLMHRRHGTPFPPCFPSCDAYCISFHTKSATCKLTMTSDRSPSDEVPCMRIDAPNRGFDRSRYTVLKNDPNVAWAVRDVLRLLRGEQVGHTSITSADPEAAERMGRVFADWFEGKGAEHKQYFVLRYDCPDGEPADPIARRALAHYADLTKGINPTFADELQGELIRTEPRVMADRDNEPHERTHTDALQAVDAAAEMIEGQEHDREASLRRDIGAAINRHSRENASDTPDYVLAEFLMRCLRAFENSIVERRRHTGEITSPVRTPVDDVLSDASRSPAPVRAVPPVDPTSLPQPKRKDD